MPDRDATVEIATIDSNGAVMFRLLRSSFPHLNMHRFVPLPLHPSTLPPLDSRSNVQSYGNTLREALYLHSAVRDELRQIFQSLQADGGAAPAQQASLQFAIGADDGEPFRWEALHDEAPDCFLAARQSCSLKRIAFAAAAADPGPRIYSLPIRMAAFLSPSKVDSQAEFGAISAAVAAAIGDGLAVRATIYLGEQDLLDQAGADIAAGRLPGIEVLPMPGDTFALERALINDPVQLVHFFCHGYAQDNVPRLEFATINDHDIGAARGSIDLSLERLGPALAAAGTVWLTVLSSCSSAQEVPRLFSMARELANTVSPVAIGMAEPMQPGDASLFADGFYRKAFEIIGNALAGMALGQTTRIDFGAAVAQARANLHSKAQAPGEEDNAFGRWCLPVMYQRDAPLKVSLASVDMRKRVALVGQTLRNLPASTPVALREQILAMLEQEPAVPPALRPDLDGSFR